MEREAHPIWQTFAEATFSQYGKFIHRERLLDAMNRMVLWAELVMIIEPVYPKAAGRCGESRDAIHL